MFIGLEKKLKYIIYVLIIGAFVSCLFLFKYWVFPYITSKAIPFRIMVELMSLVYIILALKFPKYRPKKSLILYSLLIFTGIAIITSIFGINPKLSFIGDLERMWGINMWLHLVFFFIVITNVLQTKKEWFIFLNFSLLLASYIAIYGYLQRWGVKGLFQTNIIRIQSVLGNSAYVAGILLLSSILSIYLLIKIKGFWWKFLFTAHILIQLPAMFMAEIRGAQVAFFFVLLFVSIVFLFKLKNRVFKYGILLFLILLVTIFISAFQNQDALWVKNNSILHRLTSISFSGGTARTRLISWHAGLKAFQERPIRGFGMENYYYAFDKYFQADYYNIAPTETWFDRAHNMLVENLVAHGIFGLLAYLSIFVFTLIYLFKIYRKDLGNNWLFSLFMSSLIFAYFIQNIFVFDSLAVTMMFFFILAYINSISVEELCQDLIYKGQLSRFTNNSIIILSSIIVFYLVFGMNFVSAQVAKQSYEVQRSFYQDHNFKKSFQKLKNLFILNTYMNRDSLTMMSDTLMKIYAQAKNKEQVRDIYLVDDFLIKKMQEYLKINSKDAYFQLNLARLYMLKVSLIKPETSEYQENLKEANKILKYTLKLSPERLHTYYFLAKLEMNRGNNKQALKYLETALSYNLKYADTYLYISNVYHQMGDLDNEEKYLNTAYSLKPSLKKKKKS